MDSTIYCHVEGCRYPYYHVTAGHLCGNCRNYGHGLRECNSFAKKARLQQYLKDELPDYEFCNIGGCKYHKLHTTQAHHCSLCNDRLHSPNTCPRNPRTREPKTYDVSCPICKTTNRIKSNQSKVFGLTDKCCICYEKEVKIFFPNCGHVCVCTDCFDTLINPNVNVFDDIRSESFLRKQGYDVDDYKGILKEYPSYTSIYEGMGCCTFIRRLNETSEIEGLFRHSDDSYDEEKTKKLDDFIDGYCYVNCDKSHEWTGI